MKGKLACGGSAKDGIIVLQGDHRYNIKAVLEAAGSSMDKVVKVSVFLKDMDDFGEMNAEYAKWFSDKPPARAAVQVARLPKDVDIEIEAIAVL